ncbi:S41 family peptidase, partial [Bacteroidales bacterium]|nr:S41 family peptidase [Bacteroidales bacterium]
MKTISFIIRFFLIGIFFLSVASCEKDKPTNSENIRIADSLLQDSIFKSNIRAFIWQGLNQYYLWNKYVPLLDESRYEDINDIKTKFGFYSDLEKMFNNLLYPLKDDWSWIVDDYVEQENSFQGISKSMGMDYGLSIFNSADDIIGFVYYVLPNSPAEKAGVKRGDFFIKIDGIQLNTTNYIELLEKESYTLGMATLNQFRQVQNSSITRNMVAEEINENPIFYTNTYDVSNNKVGYLVYNSFIGKYDKQLNDVFTSFKTEGINKLVIDLRYNSGGSLQSAINLASMIHSTDTNKLIFKSQYNDGYAAYLRNTYGEEELTDKFSNKVFDENGIEHAINTLGIEEVYFIVSSRSASASEAVIAGLQPYIKVKIIGENTAGKYVGSFTIKDYYTYNNGKVNPDHTWALQ